MEYRSLTTMYFQPAPVMVVHTPFLSVVAAVKRNPVMIQDSPEAVKVHVHCMYNLHMINIDAVAVIYVLNTRIAQKKGILVCVCIIAPAILVLYSRLDKQTNTKSESN